MNELLHINDPIQIGALYCKKGDNIVYSFLDLFDEIRLVNISHSTNYEQTIKSKIFKEVNSPYKVDTIPYFVAVETWGPIVKELKFLN